jgi:cyclophilin family peptidyl-prolyl cis-trans isomerase
MADSGVNRRRGQSPKEKGWKNAMFVLFGLLVAGILFLLVTTLSKISSEPSAIQQAKEPSKGTSLVDCIVTTPPTSPDGTSGSTAANGVVHITVHHDLSPIASSIFVDLVEARHFDGVFLFRVIKNFVAQFGLRHEGQEQISHQLVTHQPSNIKDVVHDKTLSNIRGTLSFAGGNPATMQVFINLGDNRRLDQENSRPFATVDDNAMKNVLDNLHMGYKDGMGQVKTMKEGEQAVRQQFPSMSQIQTCRVIVKADTSATASES